MTRRHLTRRPGHDLHDPFCIAHRRPITKVGAWLGWLLRGYSGYCYTCDVRGYRAAVMRLELGQLRGGRA